MYDVWAEQDLAMTTDEPMAPFPPPDAAETAPRQSGASIFHAAPSSSPSSAQADDIGWVIAEDPFVITPGVTPAPDDFGSPEYVPPAHDLGEVVVTGDREGTFWWFNGGNWSYHVASTGAVGDGPMPDGYYEPPVQDPEPPVSHDGQADSIAAAAQLAQVVHRVDQEIDQIPDNKVFALPDGRTITGAELKAIWDSISFHVTTNRPYGPDRGGANSNGLVALDSASITRYAAHGLAGMAYVVLHEFGHTTPSGKAYNQQFGTAYTARTGDTGYLRYDSTAPEFVSNEKYANEIGRIIATGTLLPYMSTPPHGYPGTP